MEFLVYLRCAWPADGSSAKHDRLMAAERCRVDDLVRAGNVTRIWRDPGCWATWMLWEVPSLDDLDNGIRSLPMFPWLVVEVHGLAAHPSSPTRIGRVPGGADRVSAVAASPTSDGSVRSQPVGSGPAA